MQRTDTDHEYLARAIDLATRGRGRVHPNPVVGAVVVDDPRSLMKFRKAIGKGSTLAEIDSAVVPLI